VQHHPGRFVASKAQLTLKKKCRDAALIRGHQVGRPKPDRQRNFCIVQNCSSSQRDLAPTSYTLLASSFYDRIGSLVTTASTHEAIWPTTGRQIILARLFAGELSLKLPQIRRKRRTRHARILYLAACCNNRISRS
jgi:hypothetical protein